MKDFMEDESIKSLLEKRSETRKEFAFLAMKIGYCRAGSDISDIAIRYANSGKIHEAELLMDVSKELYDLCSNYKTAEDFVIREKN